MHGRRDWRTPRLVMQWLRANGCSWNRAACLQHAGTWRLFLPAVGCGLESEMRAAAAAFVFYCFLPFIHYNEVPVVTSASYHLVSPMRCYIRCQVPLDIGNPEVVQRRWLA
jgi:hypothetical protein